MRFNWSLLTLSLLGCFEGFWSFFFHLEVKIEKYFFLALHKLPGNGSQIYNDVRGTDEDGENGKIGSYTTQKFGFLNLFIFRPFFEFFSGLLLEQHPSRNTVKLFSTGRIIITNYWKTKNYFDCISMFVESIWVEKNLTKIDGAWHKIALNPIRPGLKIGFKSRAEANLPLPAVKIGVYSRLS